MQGCHKHGSHGDALHGLVAKPDLGSQGGSDFLWTDLHGMRGIRSGDARAPAQLPHTWGGGDEATWRSRRGEQQAGTHPLKQTVTLFRVF